MLPRENSQTDLSVCIHKLLTHADVESISQACELHCMDTVRSTAQSIGRNKFSVLNPAAPLAVICGSNLVRDLPTIQNGRYEIVIPCDCSVQETIGKKETIISSIRTCRLNLNLNSSVDINMDWAEESFEPFKLFATDRDFEHLKLNNLSIPKLTLVKVDQFKSHALSTWRNIPTFNSGWVEIALWAIIILVTLSIGYCYLRYNFPWMMLGFCQDSAKKTEATNELIVLGTDTFQGVRRPTIRARRTNQSSATEQSEQVDANDGSREMPV